MSELKFGCVEHLRWIRKHMAPQDDEHKVKTCPWCGHEAKAKVVDGETLYNCLNIDCPTGHWTPLKVWNKRPIEDALTARIAELEAERRWIPVSERLPEKDGYYLVSDDHDDVLSCEFLTERRVEPIWDDDDGVLYWMPLPKPPEVK